MVICSTAAAADLHPIAEVQSGYLFGATSNGRWIKAEEAAKALQSNTMYQVYGLTQSLGTAKGGKPKHYCLFSKGRHVRRSRIA